MSGSRRCCGAVFGTIVSRCINRRFLFAIAAWSVYGAKAVHIYAHFPALTNEDILNWGFSFFAQDVALLLAVRFLLDKPLFGAVPFIRIIFPMIAAFAIFALWVLSTIQMTFFITAGSEPHWRNAMDVAGEAAAGKMMMAGLTWFLLVVGVLVVLSWVTQDILHYFTAIAVEIIKFPFAFVWSKLPFGGQRRQQNVKYAEISQQESEGFLEGGHQKEEDYHSETDETTRKTSKVTIAAYVATGLFLFATLFQYLFRPGNESMLFMSWTIPMLPLVDFTHSSPTLANLLPVHGTSINYAWDERSALDDPIKFKWLPKEKIGGFEDWYEKDAKHYTGKADPMRLSNLENDLLPELKDKLADVNIRHVMLIKLESTRKDVFPLKKNGFIWEKLSNSFADKTLPEEVQQRLANLSTTANFLTGDYDDGFEHAEKPVRGGLSMNNVHTTSTYTLKSMAGSFCGITPIVADFNIEWQNHIYQPCLPQIFEAFNKVDHTKDNTTDDFTSLPWMSQFMQSVTGGYDKQDRLMPALGFPIDSIFTMEYLKGDGAKFGKPDFADINYYGMPEYAIEPYLRDAFQTAKKDNKRVFLGHLTSTSHHPFAIPESEKEVAMSQEKGLQDLSKYLNAIGYVDTWLGHILKVLEEEGVADETLLVFVGDHGLSLPENGGVTPYFGPNVGNFHVPMVLSHPKLPPIQVNDAVSSIQILPTILDLLIETGSLSDSEGEAALDLLKNFEGQSLIRPMVKHDEKKDVAQWQYSVMNPGRAQLAVRDGRNPDWRLVVPIVDDIEWRYTDLKNDPHEKHGIRTFGFKKFLQDVEDKFGVEASNWCEEAAFMSRWWVEDNSKRWRYDPK